MFWPTAGLIDTHLRSFRLLFELHRTEIPQCGVPPPGIVEALDVIEHVGPGLGSGTVHLPYRALGLERGEEALHHRIVPDVPGPTHAASDTEVGQEQLKGLTRILAPAIGMVEDGVGRAPPPDRHHKGIG